MAKAKGSKKTVGSRKGRAPTPAELRAALDEVAREQPSGGGKRTRRGARTAPRPDPIPALAEAVRSGERASYETPAGFSLALCQTYLRDPAAWEAARSGLNEGLARQNYSKTFRRWAEAVAPGGMVVARGMHDLPLGSASALLDLVQPGQRGPESYSMNLARAVCDFAVSRPRPEELLRLLDRLPASAEDFDERRRTGFATAIESDLGTERWAAMKAPARAAWMAAHTCAVVVVARLSPAEAGSFGGDSESGDLMEAELHVRRYPPERVLRVFALAPRRPEGALAATAAEAKRYALTRALAVQIPKGYRDRYDSAFEVLLHPESRAAIPRRFKVRPIATPQDALDWQHRANGNTGRAPRLPKLAWYTLFAADDT